MRAGIAYGSLNNFDTVNDTGTECHGFEIELEDIHCTDVTYTYDWNLYGTSKISEDTSVPGHPKVTVRWASGKKPDGSWSPRSARNCPRNIFWRPRPNHRWVEPPRGLVSTPSGAWRPSPQRPLRGYAFVNWTENGVPVDGNATFSLPMDVNHSLVAHFTQNAAVSAWTLTTVSTPVAGGTTLGAGSYANGTSVTVSAAPSGGFLFKRWMDGATTLSTSANYTSRQIPTTLWSPDSI